MFGTPFQAGKYLLASALFVGFDSSIRVSLGLGGGGVVGTSVHNYSSVNQGEGEDN